MILAFADDFSGAAEVAGVAHRYGLQATVTTSREIVDEGEFVAVDMATRSMSEPQARATAEACGKLATDLSPTLLYKKTDSVLRGHLAVELSGMMSTAERSIGLLIPANPVRNRIINNGEYHIDDLPLADSEFSRDPAFPIHSSRVTDLVIGAQSLAIGTPLSGSGILIGDTITEKNLDDWAVKTLANDEVLPGGASPFLAALLRVHGRDILAKGMPNDLLPRKILLVCGSQSDSAKQITKSLSEAGSPVFETTKDKPERHATRIAKSIAANQVTVLCHPREPNYSPEELTDEIATVTKRVWELIESEPPHLCLEGGETAAIVLERLGEKRFQVSHEWEPGVVSLVSEDGLTATVKPGSYPWPTKLLGRENS